MSSPAPGRPRAGLRPEILWALALAGLSWLAGLTLWLSTRALVYPYQLLYGEGWLLEFARRLAAGEPLYKPLAEFPLGTCNYPPLTLLLARLLFPLTGTAYAAGRIWSLLATLAIAAILFAWVRQATSQALPATAAALAWLGAPYVYHWAPQFRVDLPGLAFSLAGVWVVWRSRGHRTLLAAAVLFALGLYCKQSFVAAPAAAAFGLFLSGARRRALLLAGLTLLLGGVPFLVLNATTGGEFWFSMVEANVNPFEPGRLFAQVAAFLRTYLPLALLTTALLVAWALARLPGRVYGAAARGLGAGRSEPCLAAYLALALLSAALAGKAGSWENYFLEPVAALCLGGGLALARMRSWPAGRWLAPLFVLSQVALMWHTPEQALHVLRENKASSQAILPRLKATPGLVLSEDAGLLVQAGKAVPYYDFQLTQLTLAERWDQSWEVENLRHGAFGLIIFENDARLDVEQYGRYTRTFMSALDYGYRLSERVGKYQIYRPAPLARERPVRFEGGPALVGYTLPPVEARPGQALPVDVVWQATAPMTETCTSFLHLLDAEGQGRAGDDLQAWDGLYPTTLWAAGEMVRMTYTVTLSADLPAGLYTLRTGWYNPALRRLRTRQGADSMPLAIVAVPSTLPLTAAGGEPVNAPFDEGIHLLRYSLAHEPGSLEVRLTWQGEGFLAVDYTVFVHLVASGGSAQPIAQGDGPPLHGQWPTSLWPPGLALDDLHTVPLPPDLPPGRYDLLVGLYDPLTDRRLSLPDGSDAVRLAGISLP